MDAVELARQRASELHAQAVAAGHDPWHSYEFAVAVARRRELDVEETAKGGAMLNKARATFIPSERLILHENVGSVFDQAFLVAHEIGHVELGDDSARDSVPEVDPARSAEASPVGIDRVIGYGSRQRREVQMDLFARELLLPRSVARKLHVGENLTASDIARRLGAPFEVVAQQLLDALLLPVVPPKDAEATEDRPLNQAQAEAAAHRGVAYLLEAGPGTGKTQTLVARVLGLLAEGIDPRRILLLTFSNKAAGEMTDRIAATHPQAAAAMWIGTFHAFGLDVIRRFGTELEFPTDARMMDRTEAVELLEYEFPRLQLVHYRNVYDPTQNITDILGAISRAKDEVVGEKQYEQLAEAMLLNAVSVEQRTAAHKALEVARVYAVYEQLKRQANCVDFGDLVSLPVHLLEQNAEVREHLQREYDHVLVDEYQDVNRSSVRLLAALRPSGEHLWVVGDPKQSIYRFRGASTFNVARFGAQDFAGGKRGRLRENYRSVPEIVAAYSEFARQMKSGGEESALVPLRSSSGSVPELRTLGGADEMSVAIADEIEAMRSRGYSYRDQAVLCRGNEKLADLGQDLERLGVPVLFLGSLFERPEVKDLVALISMLTDRRAMGLVRIAGWPEFALDINDVAAVLAHLRENEAPPGEWLRNLKSIEALSAGAHEALTRLAAVLAGFDHASSPWMVLATILLDRTRMAARISMTADAAQRTHGIAIWQFLNFARAQPAGRGLPIVRLMDRIRRLLRLSDERDLRQLPSAAQGIDAVRLMTMHGAKGLEFPVVHVPGMNQDSLPGAPQAFPCPWPDGMVEGAAGSALALHRTDHAEEQECIFFVALSRPKDHLFLYGSTRKSDGSARRLSPYLDRLRLPPGRTPTQPPRSLPPPPEAGGVQLAIEGKLRFEAPQLALYESCPRRFFYTHILQVGGRRASTSFMQMHEAVRGVFKSVIEGGDAVADDAIEQRVDEALVANGLAEHGYLENYRAIALAMVRFFVSTRKGHKPETPVALSLRFGEELVVVRPDDVLVSPHGRRTLRRIQTGHQRSAEGKDVGAAAFVLAARQAFPDAVVELIHLSDESTIPLDLSPKEIEGRRKKLGTFLGAIRQGQFPANASSRRCPGCPALFICGPTPAGILAREF